MIVLIIDCYSVAQNTRTPWGWYYCKRYWKSGHQNPVGVILL